MSARLSPARCGGFGNRRRRLSLALVGLALTCVMGAGPAPAQTGANAAAMEPAQVDEIDRRLGEMERTLRIQREPDEATIQRFLSETPEIRSFAKRCVSENQSRLDTVESKIETLGEVTGDDSPGVQQQREALVERRDAIERQQQLCRVFELRSDELQRRLTNIKQQRLTERLLERDAPAWSILAQNLQEPRQLWSTARLFLLRSSGLSALTWLELLGGAGLLLLCAGGAVYLRQPMFRLAARLGEPLTLTGGFVQSVLACAANVLPPLVTSLAASAYFTVIGVAAQGWAFVTLLSYGLAGYFVFVFLIRVFLAPCPPARAFVPAPEAPLRRLTRRLRTLAFLVLIVSLLSATLVVEGFPEPVRDLLRLVVATILLVELARVIWLAGDLITRHDTRLARVILVAGMVFALVAEWCGYRNMAEYAVVGIVGSLLGFALAWFVWRLIDEVFAGLDEGRHRWQRYVRETLGVARSRPMPGLLWLRVLLALPIWGGFAMLVLVSWGVSDTGIAWMLRALNQGIQLGRVELVPIRLLWGLVALVVLMGLSGWVKQRLDQRWLRRTRMQRGAREALVTISGYIGATIAIIVALGVAGVDFTNIALIAGALSVGLGFGLQNIFNNFVSGLILLFERPVKTDDWVVVGGTEGFIKRISIRSTQIQTFDHADVIVPNSELIQSQVTNWMLRDPFGLVTVPVRVAYGTDTELVHRLLMQVVEAHSQVLTDPVLAPPPEVLLRRFGDSGYEFELRAFIRDIGYFLEVQSELNLAIDRVFGEHGIVIPYPRTDIRISRTPPDPAALGTSRQPPPATPTRGGGVGGTDGGGDG
jgi:small-conductance mechanosensitive channel